VIRPDDEAMAYGAVLNRKAIETYVACESSGLWPGYPSIPVTVGLPSWITARYEEMVAAGELADPVRDLLDVIREASSRAALVAIVEEHSGGRAWTDAHHALAQARWSQVSA
jgi:hypothetical protein